MNTYFKAGTCLAAALMMSQWGFAAGDTSTGANGPETVGQQQNKSAQADTAQQNKMSYDQHFVRHAAWSGMFEIDTAKLAADRTNNSEIKQFAQRMIDDHTKANNQLEQIAQSKGMDVPKTLDPVDQAKLDQLQKMQPGRDFDRAYVYGQVAADIEAVLVVPRRNTEDLAGRATSSVRREHLPHAGLSPPGSRETRRHGQRSRAGWRAYPRKRQQ